MRASAGVMGLDSSAYVDFIVPLLYACDGVGPPLARDHLARYASLGAQGRVSGGAPRPAARAAADARASPRAIPASASDGQWARSITRAVATSTMITSAATRTSRLAGGRRLSAR